jgi:hypothetical protein
MSKSPRFLALAIVGLALLLAPQLAAASPPVAQEEEQKAVIETAMNYMEGAYTASAERMAKAVHPELTKVQLSTFPQTGTYYIRPAGATRLIEVVRGMQVVPEDQRNISLEVFDIGNDMAIVMMDSADFHDLLQIAKINGEWKIINVLWIPNPESEGGQRNPPPPMGDVAAEEQAITEAALNYIDGAYSGDADRMARGVHPELTKVRVVTHPRTGESFLDNTSASLLVEGTRAQLMLLDEADRNIEVEVFDSRHGIAVVKVVSAMYIDHLQLAKVNDEWRIVNVLWAVNPDAPGRQQ